MKILSLHQQLNILNPHQGAAVLPTTTNNHHQLELHVDSLEQELRQVLAQL
jgi:hypothetical protein